MPNAYVSLRNLQFQLFEVLQAEQLQHYAFFKEYDRESMQMAMEAALQLADQYLYPYYREMDREKAHYKDGEVWVHPAVRNAIQAMAEAGWIGAIDHHEAGGQQMPLTLLNAAVIIFNAANPNIAPYAFL